MPKQNQFLFGVKNVKYAIETTPGTWGSPIDLAYADAISLEADYSEKKLFGDGIPIAVLADDRGLTGSLVVTDINDTYEIAMGRKLAIENGTADIKQSKSVKHCLYYEVEALKDNEIITIKRWLFGVYTGKPGESQVQTKEDPTINTYEYSLNILGIPLLNALGTANFIDAQGNEVYVTRQTAFPDDTGYSTFGDAVPEPTSLT